MGTPVTTGIRDTLKEGISPEGEPYTYLVYWVSAYNQTHIFDHEHIFTDKEDANKLLEQVNQRCLIDGTPDADRFNPAHWGRQPRPFTPEGQTLEAMWEVKDALANGEHVPTILAYSVGL